MGAQESGAQGALGAPAPRSVLVRVHWWRGLPARLGGPRPCPAAPAALGVDSYHLARK